MFLHAKNATLSENYKPALVCSILHFNRSDLDQLGRATDSSILHRQMYSKQPNQKLQQTKSLARAHLSIDGGVG